MKIVIEPGSKPKSRRVLVSTGGKKEELERVDARIVSSALRIIEEEGYELEEE